MKKNNVVTYLVGDHLGSTSLTVNASTGDVVETRYKPWGEVRWTTADKTLPTRFTFTGQYSYVNDDATDLGAAGFGLMFYNARWYDPQTGRMAQADTVVPGGVQGLDRYAYVSNNPIAYVDPSGHWQEGVCRGGSDYRCQIRANKMAALEAQWARERAAAALAAAVAAAVQAGADQTKCLQHPETCDTDSGVPNVSSSSSGGNGGSSAASCDPLNVSVCYNGPIPDNLRAQLEAAGVDPKLLDGVNLVIYNHPPVFTLCGRASAYTFGNTITFCSANDFDFSRVNTLLVHELVHVRQWHEYGYVIFGVQYILTWMEVRFDNRGNPFEKEAYACADPWSSSNPVEVGYMAHSPLPSLSSGLCNLGG